MPEQIESAYDELYRKTDPNTGDPLWATLYQKYGESGAAAADVDPKAWTKAIVEGAIKAGSIRSKDEIDNAMSWAQRYSEYRAQSKQARAEMEAASTPEGRARTAIKESPWYYKAALEGYNFYQSAGQMLPGSGAIQEWLHPGTVAANEKLKSALSDTMPVATAGTGAAGSTVGAVGLMGMMGVGGYSILKGAEGHITGAPTERGLEIPKDTTLVGDVAREYINNRVMMAALKVAGPLIGKGVESIVAGKVASGAMSPLTARILTATAGGLGANVIATVAPHWSKNGVGFDALSEWWKNPGVAAAKFAGSGLLFSAHQYADTLPLSPQEKVQVHEEIKQVEPDLVSWSDAREAEAKANEAALNERLKNEKEIDRANRYADLAAGGTGGMTPTPEPPVGIPGESKPGYQPWDQTAPLEEITPQGGTYRTKATKAEKKAMQAPRRPAASTLPKIEIPQEPPPLRFTEAPPPREPSYVEPQVPDVPGKGKPPPPPPPPPPEGSAIQVGDETPIVEAKTGIGRGRFKPSERGSVISSPLTWPFKIANTIRGKLADLNVQYPKMSKENPDLALKMRNVASADIYGDRVSTDVTDRVRATGVDMNLFGSAGNIDQLRGQADMYRAKDPALAARLESLADKAVAEDFASEAVYQNFLKNPATQEAFQIAGEGFNKYKDPLFRKRQELGDEEGPPISRGRQTGIRWGLVGKADVADPLAGGVESARVGISSAKPGRLSNPRATKSPYSNRVVGSDSGYETDFGDIFRTNMIREASGSYKVQMFRAGEKSGDFVISDERPDDIKGETPVEIGRLKGKPVWGRESQEAEIRKALKTDRAAQPFGASGTVAGKAAEGAAGAFQKINEQSLVGLGDNVVNAMRGVKAVMRQPSANPWTNALVNQVFPLKIVRTFWRLGQGMRQTRENIAQQIDLAQQGGWRGYSEPPDIKPDGIVNTVKVPFRVVRKAIDKAGIAIDKAARVSAGNMYDSMVDKGVVAFQPTGKADFVNAVLGNYVRPAQADFIRWFVDSGLGPFTTAKAARISQVARTLGLDPGVKAATPGKRIALATEMLTNYTGLMLTVGVVNAMFNNGDPTGGPGTPLGHVRYKSSDGTYKTVPVIDIAGLSDEPRLIGVSAGYKAASQGMSTQDIRKDVENAIIGGPATFLNTPVLNAAGTLAVRNAQPFNPTSPENVPLTGPGNKETQVERNLLYALLGVNPLVKAGAGMVSGSDEIDTGKELEQMISYFSPKPGKSDQEIKTLPMRAEKNEVGNFVDDLKKRIWSHAGTNQEAMSWLQDQIKSGIKNPAEQGSAFKEVLDSYVKGKIAGKSPK